MESEPHKVHRLMFYNLDPQSINTISYNRIYELLAVLRNDNRVELWNMISTPFIQSTIFLKQQTKITGLVWSKKRLFGGDLDGSIKELDLVTLKEEVSYPCVSGGPCHSLAINKAENLIAAGTELGYVNIFKVKKNKLSFVKLIQSVPKRIISISWDATGEYIVTGGSKFIRSFRYSDGSVLHEMKPIFTKLERKQVVCVWSVVVTDDFTIIAGDSSGSISFWDGMKGICLNSFKTHISDILTLCLSFDQNVVYCAGIDPDIITYTRINMNNKVTKWVKSKEVITHTHDVKGLVELNDGRLCSGGVDSYLTITKLAPFIVQLYPPLLQSPAIRVCTESRQILLRYSKYLEVCHLKRLEDQPVNESPFTKLVELQSVGGELIRCADMANNGEWIAYATNTSLRIFHFSFSDCDKVPQLQLVPTKDFPIENIRHISFSLNCEVLCVANSLTFQLVYLDSSSNTPLQLIDSPDSIAETAYWEKWSTISLVAISNCGKYVALAADNGQICVWNKALYLCYLPKYDFPVTALRFLTDSDVLCVVYADYTLVEFSVKFKRYTDFSKLFESSILQNHFGKFNMPVTNIVCHVDNKSAVTLQTSSNMCAFDKDKIEYNEGRSKKRMKLSADSEYRIPARQSNSKQMQKGYSLTLRKYFAEGPSISDRDMSTDKGFHVFEKYQHLVHLDSVGNKELVVVEVKPKVLLGKLPPLLKKKKFGRK